MFRIECFVQDRNVAPALRALVGLAIGKPEATPVENAEETNGKIKAVSDGKLVHRFVAWLHNNKASAIRPKEIQDWLQKQGMSKLSGSYVSKNAVAMGVLRPEGRSSRRVYRIVRALPKPARKGGA
jgi:hypothetical protein